MGSKEVLSVDSRSDITSISSILVPPSYYIGAECMTETGCFRDMVDIANAMARLEKGEGQDKTAVEESDGF
jgi:hypothetical protein